MRTVKNRNPFHFEEPEDPALWKISHTVWHLLMVVMIMAVIVASVSAIERIRKESERKFPTHEVKAE